MIIIHEDLEKEAQAVAEALMQHWGIDSTIQGRIHEELFRRIPEFSGESYMENPMKVDEFSRFLGERAALILTPRDLYHDQARSQKDDWVLGSNYGLINFASVARLRGANGNPTQKIEVPLERYFRRLNALCMHEVGHHITDSRHAKHMKMAFWAPVVGDPLPLGLHCTDNKCLMYEVVDVKTPPREEGCLVLVDPNDENCEHAEERYDAGLDECIDRQYSDLLCGKCRDALRIDEKAYK